MRYPQDISVKCPKHQFGVTFITLERPKRMALSIGVPLGITSLSCYIKLPPATEEGIMPYGLFVALACFTYFDSDEDRTRL